LKFLDLAERILMLRSPSKRFDGLWVGIFGNNRDQPLLDSVESALMLVKQYDSVLYQHIHRRIRRIWITDLIGSNGAFNVSERWCSLDRNFVTSSSPQSIASTIVHEATHASPCLLRIGYKGTNVHRIEMLCMRRQLAFATKLPNGESVCADIRRNLARPAEFWSPSIQSNRQLDLGRKKLQELGMPNWFIGAIMFLSKRSFERKRPR